MGRIDIVSRKKWAKENDHGCLRLSTRTVKDRDPEEGEPKDFDAFCKKALEETRSHDLDATFMQVSVPFETVEVYDASFRGGNGDLIR